MPIADTTRRAAYRREWRRRNRGKMADQRFRQAYGITVAERDAMLARQGGKCAVCRTPDPGRMGWMVDHDHSCCPGQRSCGRCVRAIVCQRCNKGLGFFRDDPEVLRAAIEYLSYHGERIHGLHVKCIVCERVIPFLEYWEHAQQHEKGDET